MVAVFLFNIVLKNMEEKISLCALGKIFGFKPRTAHALISHLGNARSAFSLNQDEKDHLLGPHSEYAASLCMKELEVTARELAALESKGIYYIGCTEEHYPKLLKECSDAPIGLYIRSDTPPHELWNRNRHIAVVGTRDISPYGREWCERTVRALAESAEQPLIISGLALGTDICAHHTALESGLPTVGVMATGPESIYPHRNERAAMRMVHTPGCALVTDYPPGTAPLAIHFLRRNRIIAGLSDAVILMESKVKGGGMTTSRLAFSYDRDVYALPGRIDDIRSQGCNLLIKRKIAEPFLSTEDLIDSLGMKTWHRKEQPSDMEVLRSIYGNSPMKETIESMHLLIYNIRNCRGITVEELSDRTGIPYHTVVHLCSIMESDGLISTDLLQRCSIRAKNF